ncbi:MAG: Yip1 family protein [bacterium]
MNEIPQEPVSQEPVPTEPVALEKKSYLQRVFGIFTSPKSVFQYIDEKPDLILSLLIPVIATILVMISGAIIGFRSPEALDGMKDLSESASMMVKYGATIVISIFSVIFAVVFILIQAGIIHVIAPFLNGKGNFKSLVCVLAYASAPLLIFGVISLAYLFLNPNVYIPFTASLGMIYTAEKVGFIWNAFYQSFDLFRFWSMGLTIAGVTIVYKFNWKKAAAIILVMWLIGMGLGLGIAKFTEPFRNKAQQTQTEDTGDNN